MRARGSTPKILSISALADVPPELRHSCRSDTSAYRPAWPNRLSRALDIWRWVPSFPLSSPNYRSPMSANMAAPPSSAPRFVVDLWNVNRIRDPNGGIQGSHTAMEWARRFTSIGGWLQCVPGLPARDRRVSEMSVANKIPVANQY
jgi:hypothetical protein